MKDLWKNDLKKRNYPILIAWEDKRQSMRSREMGERVSGGRQLPRGRWMLRALISLFVALVAGLNAGEALDVPQL
ncbi:hypothetical protein AC629_04560 [Bradyrhizobium sp. NAS80.1]|nr:hypothetical protein AC629_04560 [Bradyrhizobium sp. NAS80.1]